MYLIENSFLSIMVSEQGAELQSLVLKRTGREYLWQGNQDFWGRRSPILFPIVGKLREGKYIYQGKEFQLGQHGFARDLPFQVIEHTESKISFLLQDNEKTREVFPFFFSLQVSYQIEETNIKVEWQVKNRGETEMFYSIGAHPAFNLPLASNTQPEQTQVIIKGKEICELSFQDGFLNPTPQLAKLNFPLSEVNFAKVNTLIYHTPQGASVTIKDPQGYHSVTVSFEQHFPYFGIWSAKDGGPFVCLEPWAGVLDCFNHNGKLEDKFGINRLLPSHCQHFSYNITLN